MLRIITLLKTKPLPLSFFPAETNGMVDFLVHYPHDSLERGYTLSNKSLLKPSRSISNSLLSVPSILFESFSMDD